MTVALHRQMAALFGKRHSCVNNFMQKETQRMLEVAYRWWTVWLRDGKHYQSV